MILPALAAVAGAVVPRAGRTTISAVGIGGALGALLAALTELAGTGAESAPAGGIALLGPAPTGAGTIELTLRADRLSAVVAVMVCAVALAVQVYSVGYQVDDRRYRSFAAVVSLFTAAMLLVVQADDLLLLLIGWEVMGLCSYLLIGQTANGTRRGTRPSRRSWSPAWGTSASSSASSCCSPRRAHRASRRCCGRRRSAACRPPRRRQRRCC